MTAQAMVDHLTISSIRAQPQEYRQRTARYLGVPWEAVVDADHEEALQMDSWQQRIVFDFDDVAGSETRPIETWEVAG